GQGLFLGGALLVKPHSSLALANRLLAGLVLVLVLIIGHAWLGLDGGYGRFPRLAGAIAPLPLLIGPLLWLYLRALLHPAGLPRLAWAHLAPFALALLAWAPYLVLGPAPHLAGAPEASRLPWVLGAFGALKALHLGVYLLLCWRLIAHADAHNPGQPLVQSLRRLTLGLGAGLGATALLFALEALDIAPPVSSDLAGAVVLTGFVYGVAFYAMRLPLGYRPAVLEPGGRQVTPAASLLSPQDTARFLSNLTASMEHDHAYRDGELSLEQLAQRLALTPHELSQLINQSFGMNLSDYLNGYRVAALKAALCDPAHQSATVLELALAAGFNSKSSLNRVFKKHTGQTPTEYRA
ncbi:MAG: AraC family transcriptional regulator, partial [Burkholderiales bacterium PBB5]